jgi:hypothetical protein
MSFWKNTATALALYTGLSLLAPSLAPADTVYLKNGGKLENRIVTQKGDKYIIERDFSTMALSVSAVERIEKSPLETVVREYAPKQISNLEIISAKQNTPKIYQPINTPPGHEPKTGLNTTYKPDPAMAQNFQEELAKINQEAIDSWDFNLEREVARVMLDPRVPRVWDKTWPHYEKWQRESYLPIINAARTAFHKHRNPTTGKPGETEDTITVPRNITGKDTLKIRYVSGMFPQGTQFTWGDDEDIVYITGQTVVHENQTLKILPGTIVLVAAFQDDQQGGHMPKDDMDKLLGMYFSGDFKTRRKIQDLTNPHNKTGLRNYSGKFHTVGTLLARGKENKPILVVSDSNNHTPFDFSGFAFNKGICDYLIDMDHDVTDGVTNNTVSSRNMIHYHLGSGRNGAGLNISNYFGDAYNEGIDVHDKNIAHNIYYNLFNNNWNNGITLAFSAPIRILNNTFIGNENIKSGNRGTIASIPTFTSNNILYINNNNFFTTPIFVHDSETDIDISNNYFGTTNPEKIKRDIYVVPGLGKLNFTPFLRYPDSDMDGVPDNKDHNSRVMDIDHDGLIDGRDTKPLNPDQNRNGIPDGIDLYRTNYKQLMPVVKF